MAGQHRHPNQDKWIVGPTYEQVRQVINAFGVGAQQFQRFHGMSRCLLRYDKRPIPAKYWHIFYEYLALLDEGKPLPFANPAPIVKIQARPKRGPYKTIKGKPTNKPQLIKDLL